MMMRTSAGRDLSQTHTAAFTHRNGELFVHAPIAPTDECVTMLKELGEVKYIVLPVTAVEHKVRAFISFLCA